MYFDINYATSTVTLDDSGKGELTCKVTNLMKQDVRAQAKVVPEGKTEEKWLSLDAPAKDLKSDGTITFTQRISVPKGTPADEYRFHIVVSADDRPEEKFREGPSVSFKAPEIVIVIIPWWKRLWWVFVVAGGVLLVGGGVAYFIWRHGGPKPGDPCPDGKCPKGLTCVTRGDAKTCLLAVGAKCADSKECATNRCEGGKCSEVTVQTACRTGSDCDDRELCVKLAEGQFCLFRGGETCRSALDCASKFCKEDGICADEQGRCKDNRDCLPQGFFCKDGICRKTDGQVCTASAECASGFCTVGADPRCAPPPPAKRCEPPCRFPLHCIDGACTLIRFDRLLRQDPGRVPVVREVP